MKFRRSDSGLMLPDHDMPRRMQPLCMAAPQQALLGVGGGSSNFSQVSLLLHCDGTNGGTSFPDHSSHGHTVTPTSVTTSTAQSKWGGASALIASSGGNQNRLTVPNHSSLNFGTAEFTLEFWIYLTTVQTAIILVKAAGTGAYPWVVFVNGDKIQFNINSGSTILTGTTSLSANTWYFVQARRRNTGGSQPGYAVFALAINGVQEASSEVAATGYSLVDNTDLLSIGNYNSGATFPVVGHLDDIRLTNGEGRDFAVPTGAFPNS